jgi:hypothetical protein
MRSGFDLASRWPDPTFRRIQMSGGLKNGLPFAVMGWSRTGRAKPDVISERLDAAFGSKVPAKST